MKINAAAAALVVATVTTHTATASPPREPAPVMAGDSVSSGGAGRVSPGARTQGWFTMPDDTSTLSTTFTFLTARSMQGTRVRFTDVVLASVSGSHALTDRLELHAGATFVPKQTSVMDEKVFQSASASALYALGKSSGIMLGGSAGPMMDSLGRWASGALTMRARPSIEKWIQFDLGLAANYTALRFNGAKETYGFSEVVTNADLVFWGANRRGSGGAAWLGVDFAFPLFDTDEMGDAVKLSPQARANFHLGAALSVNGTWDLFLKLSVLDRGDADQPNTELPILAGGFDQTLFTVGVSRQFADEDDDMHGPRLAY